MFFQERQDFNIIEYVMVFTGIVYGYPRNPPEMFKGAFPSKFLVVRIDCIQFGKSYGQDNGISEFVGNFIEYIVEV